MMIIQANALKIPLPGESVHCVVTSPPYWGLRDYGYQGQLGLEKTPEEYVANLVQVFREVKRVLRADGTVWLNLGDSYASGKEKEYSSNGYDDPGWSNRQSRKPPPALKPKDLCMIPARVALALQKDGWFLRSMIPWIKRNCMPESVDDRPTTAVEYIFLLTKSKDYFYDAESIKLKAADDTHARYARGRSNSHKWSDGGPGDQTIAHSFAHMLGRTVEVPDSYHGSIPGRKDGPGQDRRSRNDRPPGVHPKSTEPGSGIKANSSFEAAVKDIVGRRARRNSDWFFESWQGLLGDEDGNPLAMIVNSSGFSGAHFATFPPKMVEPCLKAGTSERGVCPECGGPWVRVLEHKNMIINRSSRTHELGRTRSSGTMVEPPETKILGWKSSCKCGEERTVPAVVLDPFGGSGTVGLVSQKLNRHFVCLELKMDYCKMAKKRIWNADVAMI